MLKRPDSGTDMDSMAGRLASEMAEGSSRSRPVRRGGTVPGRILVVDDEALLLRSMRRILEADGQEVVLVQDPDDIGASLQDPDLDVVLLDLFMAGVSGLDILDRVKRERPEVEVVMMTGQASIESAVR